MLEGIKKAFDWRFATWQIQLPEEDLRLRRGGSITKNGWTINYRFGKNAGADFLKFFASHRMTNDTLNRIDSDGREVLLGYCQEFFQANNERAQEESYRHNREFLAAVEERGLLRGPRS
jgi:hypothetical protein